MKNRVTTRYFLIDKFSDYKERIKIARAYYIKIYPKINYIIYW